MRSTGTSTGGHTLDEWLRQPEDRRLELIDGELLEKAAPDAAHGFAQARLVGALGPPFNRKGGAGGPGGWWLATEVDLVLNGNGFRPDVAGWRRERVPQLPTERPVTLAPDWLCEVVSESNAARDTVLKLSRYHQAKVPNYWLVDPRAGTLNVFRYHPEGYLLVLAATRPQVVHAEPFDAIALRVGVLFGDDPDE